MFDGCEGAVSGKVMGGQVEITAGSAVMSFFETGAFVVLIEGASIPLVAIVVEAIGRKVCSSNAATDGDSDGALVEDLFAASSGVRDKVSKSSR